MGLHADATCRRSSTRCASSRGRGNAVARRRARADRARARCDRVVELGPGAGSTAGASSSTAPPAALDAADGSRRRGARCAPMRTPRAARAQPREASSGSSGARAATTCRDVTVRRPARRRRAPSPAPSGSGKSTLVEEVLYRALARARRRHGRRAAPGAHDALEGASGIGASVLVDQAPLGRTSRGNPATYTGAGTASARASPPSPRPCARGLTPAHFSFNVAAGRCEACSGEGSETVEMQFLADVALLCPVCRGKRFKDEVLGVHARRSLGRRRARAHRRRGARALRARGRDRARRSARSRALGLGYLALGQPLSTLSGRRGAAAQARARARRGGAGRAVRARRAERGPARRRGRATCSRALARARRRGRQRGRRRARSRRHPRGRLGHRSRPRRWRRRRRASSPRERPTQIARTDTRTGPRARAPLHRR